MRRQIVQAVLGVIAVAAVVAALVLPAGAHLRGVNHVWNAHIKPKLSTPGTINDPGNPVDWTKLKNVPTDFADGVDNAAGGGGGGDLTTGISGYHDAPIDLPNSLGTILTLPLPAGKYAINAKLYVTNFSGGNAQFRCVLTTGEAADQQVVDVGNTNHSAMALQVISNATNSSGGVRLQCTDNGVANARAEWVKITAIALSNFTNQAI